MSTSIKTILTPLTRLFRKKRNRRVLYLLLICFFALWDFFDSGLVRRTFVFYSTLDAVVVIEERFLHRSGDRETDIRRYVDEVLLGPKSQELALLFYRGTRVHTFMYRDGVVFVNLTYTAALPPPEVGTTFDSFLTLNKGIRRNFPYVKDVRLFIGGNHVFFNEFREIFGNSADNSKT